MARRCGSFPTALASSSFSFLARHDQYRVCIAQDDEIVDWMDFRENSKKIDQSKLA